MFAIRHAQIETLNQATTAAQLESLADHVRQFSPKHAELLGVDGVRRMVNLGVVRAGAHKLFQSDVVRLYIDLMFMLGSSFDSDPQFAWIRSALQHRPMVSEVECADEIFEGLQQYLADVAGPKSRYATNALKRVRDMPFADLSRCPDNLDAIAQLLQSIYPEKASFVGRSAIRSLLREPVPIASASIITDHHNARPLVVGTMFALGHGCFEDPQFAWLSSFAESWTASSAERLYRRCMTYLNRALAYLEAS